MTAPRTVVRGATLAISRRTTCRKAALGDWHENVGRAFLYSLADAQRRTGIEVHSAVRVVTHHHTQVTLTDRNLNEFLRWFHGDMASAMNALLSREGYDRLSNVFDGRQTGVMRLFDVGAQLRQAVYDHLNPVAAGLVENARHMPGQHSDYRLWKAGGLRVPRPDVYFGKDRPAELWLKLTPPPLMMAEFRGDVDAIVHRLTQTSQDFTSAIRRERRRPAMGAQRLRRLHPWSEPTTPAEPPGQACPAFKIAANLVGRVKRERRGWLERYRGAWKNTQRGVPAVYPSGTDKMVTCHHHAEEPAPPPDEIWSQPGLTSEDVLEKLAENRSTKNPDAQSCDTVNRLTRAVRDACRNEAAVVVSQAEVEFTERTSHRATIDPATVDEPARDQPRDSESESSVRRKCSKSVEVRDTTRAVSVGVLASRVVVLRDRRRTPAPGKSPPTR